MGIKSGIVWLKVILVAILMGIATTFGYLAPVLAQNESELAGDSVGCGTAGNGVWSVPVTLGLSTNTFSDLGGGIDSALDCSGTIHWVELTFSSLERIIDIYFIYHDVVSELRYLNSNGTEVLLDLRIVDGELNSGERIYSPSISVNARGDLAVVYALLEIQNIYSIYSETFMTPLLTENIAPIVAKRRN